MYYFIWKKISLETKLGLFSNEKGCVCRLSIRD